MSFFSKLFADQNERTLRPFKAIVPKINALEGGLTELSDDVLRSKTADFKDRLSKGATLDELLPETFAVVREVARRTLGERHFDVQLLGGMVLHNRAIAEMRTGEGKTLVATLPAYLNALSGKGVHIVTVNDYLSRRDASWMGRVYHALGMSVGIINHDGSYLYDPAHSKKVEESNEAVKILPTTSANYEFLRPCTRREAYEADITYGTNNEFGFDYLRDNLEYEERNLRQREFNYAIVDEIDSILIDEARTPLIIAAPTTESEDLYRRFSDIVRGFKEEADYTVEEKHRTIQLTEAGIEKAENLLKLGNIYTEGGAKYVHHLETAVRAKALFRKDKEYVVKDGEVIIVDEFTGRMQPGRRWSEGLHQAVEAKEGVSVRKESRTFASITFQNYFRLYKKLAGMTGTAMTSSEEFIKVYGLDVVAVPTNKLIVRVDKNDLIFQTEQGKWKMLAKHIKEISSTGQPILIGTVSIEKNELLSAYLRQEGVRHEILNAKNHAREAEIISQAGRKGSVTIATNMAGRGVDIKLGGNPTTPEETEEIRRLGGLAVFGTERHEARRIDNQLRGRSGRQGDPGITQFFVSLEDTLMRVFASDTIKKLMGSFGIPEDEPIENRMITRSLESAQTKIEGFNFDSRKHILEFDDVMNHQRKIIYERRRAVLLGDRLAIDTYIGKIGEGNTELVEAVDAKKKDVGEDIFYKGVRVLILQAIDLFWVDHLELMDYTRSSVNLRAYGQRDPLVEYKKEGLRLFREMESAIGDQVARLIPNLGREVTRTDETIRLTEVKKQAQLIGSGDEESDSIHSGNSKGGSEFSGVGRNDPCPCGSGKKFKKCHGA